MVEDDLDSVHTMAALLKAMGHEVHFAINGFSALTIARRYRPDVVLLDIELPDFSGCEIARKLRGEGLNMRFIAVSAMPEEPYRERALAAGCERFYRKPMDPAVLEKLLDEP